MNVRVSNDFSNSTIRTLAHRCNVRTVFRVGIILEDIRAGVVSLGLGIMCKVELRVSRGEVRSA